MQQEEVLKLAIGGHLNDALTEDKNQGLVERFYFGDKVGSS